MRSKDVDLKKKDFCLCFCILYSIMVDIKTGAYPIIGKVS